MLYYKMPKKYTKAQKAAYAKKMQSKKTKPAKVSKQNQFRVEYKDRITEVIDNDLTINSGGPSSGPANTQVLIPEALTRVFPQGTSNGQVDGNNINLKYLNMKVKLDFTELPQYVQISPDTGANTKPLVAQRYNLTVRQAWVKKDMRDFLTATFVNPNSKREQASFPTEPIANQGWIDTADLYTYQSRLQPEFLTYSRKEKTDVVVLKSMRILGEQTKTFQDEDGQDNISPDKHLTFNWTMPKVKQLLSPIADDGTQMVISSMWVPVVLVSLDRKYTVLYDETGKAVPPTPLKISHISHLTYTDS